MTETITAEQAPTTTPPTEQQLQDACMIELIKVADRHGYIIKAVVAQLPNTGEVVVIGAQLGLQRKAQ